MEHSIYLSGIKNALRARGITYIDLAEKLKMTESGVKKMLNSKDISFRRVLQICETLNILPGQLFTTSEEASIPVLTLTAKQEDALINNRLLLMVYWRFAIEKLAPTEITKQSQMSENEIKKSLQKLVNLDLITQRRGRFFAKHEGKFRWPDNSKLARLLNQEWSIKTLKKALKAEDNRTHRLSAMKLTHESYQDLLNRLSTVFDDAVRTSEREGLTTSGQKMSDVTALFAVIDEGPFTDVMY